MNLCACFFLNVSEMNGSLVKRIFARVKCSFVVYRPHMRQDTMLDHITYLAKSYKIGS